MQRFNEGQYADGAQVAEQNINKAPEIEYFYSKGYHEHVIKHYDKLQTD